MEDNTPNDNDPQETPPSGKKIKLNDGGSRNIATITETNTEYFNHAFSGETTESSTSSSSSGSERARALSSRNPRDEVMLMRPSTSGVQAIVFNITRDSRANIFGRRSRPFRRADSYTSDEDSEYGPRLRFERHQFFERNDSTSYADGDSVGPAGLEDSTDEDLPWSGAHEENNSDDEHEHSIPAVLLKERPKHKHSIAKEILNRELGLSHIRDITHKDDIKFTQRFRSSLHAVLRLDRLHSLNKHNACVNCLDFHLEGRLLVSGSDDSNVIVWDWAHNIPLHVVPTDHKSYVFQCRFIDLNSSSQLNIVTCGRDGQVRLAQCGSAGGSWSKRRLAGHGKAANKLFTIPQEPYSVLSAGEDGVILHCDLRADSVNKLVHVKERNTAIALYSLDGHPLEPREMLVTGRDKFVRVYDRRKSNKPLALYSPTLFTEEINIDRKTMRITTMYLTCAVYNHDGTEILGTYNDDDIYLFDTKTDEYRMGDSSKIKKGYSKRYAGHRNSATLKSVTFYGSKSEYVVSGSDCGYIYIWDKETESIVQWLQGDYNGMVNNVEVHPHLPILASTGLDKDVKIWAPYSNQDPNYTGLKKIIRRNNAAQWQAPLFNNFIPNLYRPWPAESTLIIDDEDIADHGQIELEANMCASF